MAKLKLITYYLRPQKRWNHSTSFNLSIIRDALFKYRKSAFALFMLATLGILYGTLVPSNKLPKVDLTEIDKLVHFIMFAVWTFLFGLIHAIRKKGAPNLWMVFSLGLFYGMLVEILQFFVPTNRSPEALDFIADVIGSGAAVLLLKWIFRAKK